MSGWNYTESDGKDAQKPQVSSLLGSRGQGKAVICRDRLVRLANVDTQYKTPFSSGVLQKTSFITFLKKSTSSSDAAAKKPVKPTNHLLFISMIFTKY